MVRKRTTVVRFRTMSADEIYVASVTPRGRLLAAMAASVQEHGLRDTTVAEVVRRAGTSRRTFYEHFTDIPDAFLVLYAEQGIHALAAADRAVADEDTFEQQLRAGVQALLGGLDQGFSRSHAIDIFWLGETGLAARRRLHDAYAHQFRAIIERARPDLIPIDDAFPIAVVGAVQELVLRRVERGESVGPAHVELADEIVRVLSALLGSHA